MLNESSLDATIEAYCAGDTSAEALDVMQRWLAERPERERELELLRQAWRVMAVPQIDALEAKRARFRNRIAGQERITASLSPTTVPVRPSRSGWRNSRSVTAWAAATLLVLVIAWGGEAALRGRRGLTSPRTYVTGVTERATVVLDDDTQVILAPQTTLVVDSHFGRRDRSVALSGEAVFNVRASTGTPFLVRTGAVSTRVLGTTFAIRYRSGDDAAYVAVMTGKVRSGGRHGEVLPARTRARVTDSTVTAIVTTDAHPFTDWAEERLVFEGASVPTVLGVVGRWYGYRFTLADSALANKHVTAAFKMADAADMMTTLRALLEVDMQFDGSVVTLTPRSDRRPATLGPRRDVPMRGDVFKPSMEMGR